tara:strand:+ start:7658 stop:8959 length:1302 start_codon:yes stop_codon:yes gene_type:complete
MNGSYSDILISDNSTQTGAKSLQIKAAISYLKELDLDYQKINIDSDLIIFNLSKKNSKLIEPLICMRCRVSFGLYKYIERLYNEKKEFYEVNLFDMLSLILLDDGSPSLYIIQNNETKESNPVNWDNLNKVNEIGGNFNYYSLEIIYNWNPVLSNLSTFINNRSKGNEDLKKYLKSKGCLLIRDWALLGDSSQTRVRNAWTRCGEKLSLKYVESLHDSYLKKYKECRYKYIKKFGKNKKWEPDIEFLESLSPPQEKPENLILIAEAIRKYLCGVYQARDIKDYEDNPSESVSENNLNFSNEFDNLNLILEYIKESSLEIINEIIGPEKSRWSKDPDREKAWKLFSMGYSQRFIAKECNHKQSWVSKLIPEKSIKARITQKTAKDLSQINEFQILRVNPLVLENFITELGIFLGLPEQEGDIPLLRKLVARVIL